MPRKRKKLKEKNTNQLPNQSLKINPSENKLLERLSNLTRGLFYISETDAEIMPFIGDKTPCLTQAEILRQTKSAAGAPVAELNFTDFFSRLTEMQDWYGEEEKEIAQKFARLKVFLETTHRKFVYSSDAFLPIGEYYSTHFYFLPKFPSLFSTNFS